MLWTSLSEMISSNRVLTKMRKDRDDIMERDSFKAFGEIAENYGDEYHATDLSEGYPANKYRLEIVMKLLKRINPNNIIDVGCGTADPMIRILDEGFNVRGFDLSEEMVAVARKNINKYGYPRSLVTQDDMECLTGFHAEEYDCAIALGSVYYTRDFNSAINNIVKLIKPKGHFVFSLRNELFSLFSMNEYTVDFIFNKLVKGNILDDNLRSDIFEYINRIYLNADNRKGLQNIDDMNVHSLMHNPLTIQDDVCIPHELELKTILFYHYHAFPPIYEEKSPRVFREISAEMEKPTDWRGYFMASAFVVHAVKR